MSSKLSVDTLEETRDEEIYNPSLDQSVHTVDADECIQRSSEKQKKLVNISVGELESLLDSREAKVKSEMRQMEQRMQQRVDKVERESEARMKPEEISEKEAEGEWHAPFGDSIYTLFYLLKGDSMGFLYSALIYLIQMSTVILTLVDIVDPPSTGNPLRIPPMVDLTVTIAQAINILIAVAYMGDLIEALVKIQFGFYPEVLETQPGATYATWLFACVAQFGAGALVLVACFILTMQSSTVLDLMLNFAALHFIADIDDIGFKVAKMGFITNQIKLEAESVADFRIPNRNKSHVFKRFLYSVTLALLYVGYGFIKFEQLNGHYLPNYLYVQFGDAYNPKLPFYSGILSSGSLRTLGYRTYYDLGTEDLMLAYCNEEKSWTFSDTGDPCDYFAKSHPTTSFDVSSIQNSEWAVRDRIDRLLPFDSFILDRKDCDPSTCQGRCVDGLCECHHSQFGMDCEFEATCPDLVLDGRTVRFPIIWRKSNHGDPFLAGDEFYVLKSNVTGEYARAYNMPVYYSDRISPASIMFFAGHRWVITSEDGLLNYAQAQLEEPGKKFFPDRVAAKFATDFHGYKSASYIPYFLSDPVDYGTPLFQSTPADLEWWSVGAQDAAARSFVPDAKVETSFNCLSCLTDDGLGFCGIGGVCNQTTGLCECFRRYEGDKCEVFSSCADMDWPCYGDGSCDQHSGTCNCNLPYGDKLCIGTFACYEEGGECRHGGSCNTAGKCNCPDDPHITGAACEKFADCHAHGCANGGVCARNGKCVCRPPYRGILCDLVDQNQTDHFCSGDEDCINGNCNMQEGVCTCADPASFGTFCEHQYNCTWGGCSNNGVCDEIIGICGCPEPFFGPDCALEPKCTDDDTYCETVYGSGSECDPGSESCRCGWADFYVGKPCTTNCKIDGGCKNGGVCNSHGNATTATFLQKMSQPLRMTSWVEPDPA